MKMSLMNKLSLGILLAVLVSIILVSLISNAIIDKEFSKYLVGEHKTKIENAINIIEDLYKQQDSFSNLNHDELRRYSEMQGLYIEIKDLNNETVYTSGNAYLQHNNMMRGMMGSMMPNFTGMDSRQYTENTYPLVVDDNRVGTVIIGYINTSFLSRDSIAFIRALNYSFVISAFIALAFGLLISIIISRQLSDPLIKITQTSNQMRTGNLEVRSLVKTSTKEIAELSNSINYLAETLSSQEMLRKRLTADIAHELRTPLTTLKTHLEAFIDGVWEPTAERFEIFYEEINRLTKLVDNLRDLAKLEQRNNKMNNSEVNISNEMGKLIESFKPLFIKENYQLDSDIEPEINALIDIDKFKQIMNNLLSNAYKYLKPNGRVEVTLAKQNKNIIIKVKDNGIGIPEKDLPFVFERFYRSDISRSKNTGGSGIGLTITKSFVEAIGGRISVQSSSDIGTTFTIVFLNIILS
ncbi:MAG TPA: HAMP domain-containing sensor histidine kinase [Patescibacteria group bacterium]|nr:HAMP domain-containing sensor histidine kinase [Patescibacteria group bacterium]